MTIIMDKYQVISKIGKGGFGTVYKGIIIETDQRIAIKKEKKIKYNRKEFIIYKLIQDKDYTANVIDYVERENKSYLILPLYGSNCIKILKKYKNSFNLKDVCMLGIQIVKQLKVLHSIDVIHRDIKPDNFVYDFKTNKFKLIDFGLAKPFKLNDDHIKFKKSSSRAGTLRYMSINCHNKYSLSRRDDLISLAYSIIFLYKKNLPWRGIKDKKKAYNLILDLKKDYNEKINNIDLPEPLSFLLSYSSNLNFSEEPNYSFIIQVLYDFIKRTSKYDGKWSWLLKSIDMK